MPICKSIHCKVRSLPDLDAADIRFSKIGIDLHLGQILSDLEQCWRLQAGGDGLPHIHFPVDHHAGHR